MWIQTFTGRKFNPFLPRESEIDIKDIIRSLRYTSRFNGHTIYFYSVLQHSLLVSDIIRHQGGGIEEQIWGLLHDAAEAYISDIPAPVKRNLFGVEEIENRILEEVAKKFELCFPVPRSVFYADEIALAIEKRDILPVNLEWDYRLPKIPENVVGYKIEEMDYSKVEVLFECRWNMLILNKNGKNE